MSYMRKNKIFIFVILFFAIAVFGNDAHGAAGEEESIIREDCAGYTRCYTSLQEWEQRYGGVNFSLNTSCNQGDLVCYGKSIVARIEGSWANPDMRPVEINGWITSGRYYIKIYTAPEARHAGVWNESKYRLVMAEADGIVINERHVRIEGLQIHLNHNQPYSSAIRTEASSASDVRVSHTILRGRNGGVGEGSGGLVAGVNSGADATHTVWNTSMYDFLGQNASAIKTYFGSWNIYNNTLYNTTYGMYATVSENDAITAINNIAQATSNGFFGTFSSVSKNNLSDLSADAPGQNSKNSATVGFVNAESRNLHLLGNDTAAKDAGADLSTLETFSFSDDVGGETRVTPWDIGADETFLPAQQDTGAVSDTTSPVVSEGGPSGQLLVGTRETTLSVRTNENAVCRYATTSGIVFDSMAYTFITTGGTAHTTSVTGLANGTSYLFYVRCRDEAGNATFEDYSISFLVSSGSTEEPEKVAASDDRDDDGLSDSEEYFYGTDNTVTDTDGDGISDFTEVQNSTDPTNFPSALRASATLLSRVRGKILLQVQRRGEAWYINPVNDKRYFLRDGDAAYQIMRKLGLGITDRDLAKIPEAGTSQTGDTRLINRLKGKILLQVEKRGEAWYINPVDGKRYYLKDGPTAYQFMRNLGLGIRTQDLITIPYTRL